MYKSKRKINQWRLIGGLALIVFLLIGIFVFRTTLGQPRLLPSAITSPTEAPDVAVVNFGLSEVSPSPGY